MPLTPGLLGTAAFVLVAGVAGGAVIGKVPPMKHLAPDYLLPASGSGPTGLSARTALPDHYPITTPEGRFEVYELADRGLYRTARYAASRYAGYDYPADFASAAFDAPDEGEADEAVDDRFAATGEPIVPPDPAAADPAPPPTEDTATEPAPTLAWGLPRMIDVEAELAAHP